jgi:hypothetical protein
MGKKQGSLSLVSTIEELLGRKSSCSGLEIREYGRGNPLRWPRDTLYPLKLALTSPTSGDRSVGLVHSRIKATEFFFTLKVSLKHITVHVLTSMVTINCLKLLIGNCGAFVFVILVFNMWSRPWSSVSHSDGSFFLLCCVCLLWMLGFMRTGSRLYLLKTMMYIPAIFIPSVNTFSHMDKL